MLRIVVNVQERDAVKQGASVHVVPLQVLESTSIQQLQKLVLLKLASQTASSSPLLRHGEDAQAGARPKTAPANSIGRIAQSLDTSFNHGVDSAPLEGGGDRLSHHAHSTTLHERLLAKEVQLHFVLQGRLLEADAHDATTLDELGVVDGVTIHCLATVSVKQTQDLSCHPRSCTTDGGRVVHVLGERFIDTPHAACRFGTIAVPARVEDDGAVGGVADLVCLAPSHPAGPVTLSITFDGISWLPGPTFWFLDASSACPGQAIPVPASCRGVNGVRTDATFGSSMARWDRDNDRDPGGAGCV
mmetsp:Transcript_25591/g.59595  ORF Transcript_25591/g.59595 Transcript_25591/m.59595 type:complete len:302 (-) Transcript_25591:6-911(-)